MEDIEYTYTLTRETTYHAYVTGQGMTFHGTGPTPHIAKNEALKLMTCGDLVVTIPKERKRTYEKFNSDY